MSKKKIAVFASGTGTNARNIFAYFKAHPHIEVKLLVCNNPKAGVFQYADDFQIKKILVDKATFFAENSIVQTLRADQIDFIVLAGFLWKVPDVIISNYPGKILNVHPALLPNYGGKGMYGMHVHKAVLANHEKESGITIHLVDEVYDNGEILFQKKINLAGIVTPEELADKIKALEHRHFPEEIERYVLTEK